jgi:hypothetical protein
MDKEAKIAVIMEGAKVSRAQAMTMLNHFRQVDSLLLAEYQKRKAAK